MQLVRMRGIIIILSVKYAQFPILGVTYKTELQCSAICGNYVQPVARWRSADSPISGVNCDEEWLYLPMKGTTQQTCSSVIPPKVQNMP